MSFKHGTALVVLDGSPQTLLDPVTTAEAKSHMRVDTSDDDTLIGALITAARKQLEGLCGRKFMQQTVVLYLDDFPEEDHIEIPVAPLISVTSIKYTDSDDAQTTMDSDDYLVDTVSPVPRVVLRDDADWPSPASGLREANAVELEMEVGYGDASQVPEPIKLAIKMLTAHYYEHREESTPLDLKQIPMGVMQLISEYRQWERIL